MAPTLEEIQAAMTASILEGSPAVPGEWLSLPEGVDATTRVGVYIGGYPARINESMREAYPAIANILGDETFASLCERHTARLVRPHRNLNAIGAGLPTLLASDPLLESLPFLADLARLEWAIQRCFHSRPLPAFDGSRCGAWDMDRWERARIGLQPEMSVVRSDWPLRALRAAKDQDRDAIDIDLGAGPEQLLVRRWELDVVTESISALEAHAIERFRSGETLGEVMEALAAEETDEDAVLGLFSRWASLGLVTSCE